MKVSERQTKEMLNEASGTYRHDGSSPAQLATMAYLGGQISVYFWLDSETSV